MKTKYRNVLLKITGCSVILFLVSFGACMKIADNPFLNGFRFSEFETDGPLKVYNRESLFQFMNGEAEAYLAAGFELLYVQTYVGSGTGSMITMESYDMGTSEGAGGIFSDYSGEGEGNVERLGDSAWTDGYIVLFRRGRFFCRALSDPSYETEAEPPVREIIALCRELDGRL